jgi:hypothetical protein
MISSRLLHQPRPRVLCVSRRKIDIIGDSFYISREMPMHLVIENQDNQR